MMAKILPCPFCGQPAVIMRYSLPLVNNEEHFYVACGNANCGIIVESQSYDTEQEAVEAWNKRSNEELIHAYYTGASEKAEEVLSAIVRLKESNENWSEALEAIENELF